MAIFDNFPYTDFHELNLDWLIKETGEVKKLAENIGQSAEAAAASAEASASSAASAAEQAGLSEQHAIDSQASADSASQYYDMINSLLNYHYDETQDLSLTYEDYYIKASDGVLVSSPTYKTSNVFEVPAYTLLTFTSWCSGSAATLCETTSDGTYKKNLYAGSSADRTYEYVSDTTTYVRICYNSNNISDPEPKLTPYNIKSRKITQSLTPQYLRNGSFTNSPAYQRGDSFIVYKGETVRFTASGSSSMDIMTEWYPTSGYKQTNITGDGKYHVYEWTAPDFSRITLCSRTDWSYSAPQGSIYVDPSVFAEVEIFFKALKFKDDESPLLNKSVSFLGDSIVQSDTQGYDSSAWHIIALDNNMTENDLGVNGSAMAEYAGSSDSVVQRLASVPSSDYIIVVAGSNDFNQSVPIGEDTDAVTTTFKGAINTTIDTLKTSYPEAKMMFVTLPKRYNTINSLGLTQKDYSKAMIEACAGRSIPVFDMYSDLGIDLSQSYAEVFDQGAKFTGTRNYHFSPDAWRWMKLRLEALISNL